MLLERCIQGRFVLNQPYDDEQDAALDTIPMSTARGASVADRAPRARDPGLESMGIVHGRRVGVMDATPKRERL
jgi:hypothetical protein